MHQLVPRVDERVGSFALKLDSQFIDVNTGFSELCENFFAIAAVGRKNVTEFAVVALYLNRGLLPSPCQ
jgi:hypothetical protein